MNAKAAQASVKEFIHAYKKCLQLSWRASRFYTLARIAIQIIDASLPFFTILLTKTLIDLLFNISHNETTIQGATVAVLAIGAISMLKIPTEKILQYSQGMHEMILEHYLQEILMGESLCVDMEYFDSPDFKSTYFSVRRDIYAISQFVWNGIRLIRSVFTLIGALSLLANSHIMYAVILICTVIPAALVDKKHTKLLYTWQLGNTGDERKMNYFHDIASNRQCASDVRFFELKELLLRRYRALWKNHIMQKKS